MIKHTTLPRLALAALLVLSACSKDNGGTTPNPNPNPNPGGGTPGPRFVAVRSIVQSNCTSCHGGGNPQSGINFSSDATIVAQKDRIKVRAVDQAGTASQMPPPPAPALTAANRTAITDWINAGGRLTD